MNLIAYFGGRKLLADMKRFSKADEGLGAYLLKSASGTFALKIVGTGLGFVSTLLLARILGAAEYGAYANAMAWLGLLGIPATLGFPQLLVRDIAVYHAKQDWVLLRGLLYFSNRMVISATLLLAALAAWAAWMLFGETRGNSMLLTLWVALAALPFTALLQLRQSAMRGFQRVIYGQIPELAIRPFLFLLLILCALLFYKASLSASAIMALNLVSLIIAFLVSNHWLHKVCIAHLSLEKSLDGKKSWVRSAFLFLIISGFQVANVKLDIAMLGVLDSPSAVGVYSVASSTSWLMTIVIMTVNTVLAPQIARLWNAGELVQLQHVISSVSRYAFLFSLVLWALFITFGKWILLLFGTDFVEGYIALSILATSFLLCTSAAAVGLLLMMTGHEKHAARLFGGSALLNVLLNILLIPSYSMTGAALATGISVLVMNIGAGTLCVKYLGINPTMFAFESKEK